MTPRGLEFLVLTGFLGSGKTTLLRSFLACEEAGDTAVIVNEVGEIGLDGALLREVGGNVAMTTLANGCICCQMGNDLATTVEALLAAERPGGVPLSRIVLETSGVSKPGPILRQLASLAQHRLRVSVVATYDPTRPKEIADFEEAAAQWAGAHRIVVTKSDLVPARRFAAAAREVAAINPLAEIVQEKEHDAAVARTFAPPVPGASPVPPFRFTASRSHARIRAFLLRQREAVPYDDLAAWLDNLAGLLGDRLLRLKGLVAIHESASPLLVQSVGTLFSEPRPFPGDVSGMSTFLVVIGRDIEASALRDIEPRLPFVLSDAPSASRRLSATAL